MAEDKLNKNNYLNDDDSESGSSTGGKGGSGVEFRDFLSTGENARDDLLPEDEKRRLLIVHSDEHQIKVKKQKDLRHERDLLKSGKFTQNRGYEGSLSRYKTNPKLNVAQFSGVDKQVSALPNEHLAETNQEKKEELLYQNRLQNRLENRFENQPKFIPPKLTPR